MSGDIDRWFGTPRELPPITKGQGHRGQRDGDGATDALALSPLAFVAVTLRTRALDQTKARRYFRSAQPANEAPALVATIGGASEAAPTARGLTASEIRLGISAPFIMKLGIEAAFGAANAMGGVYGRQLRLIAADDGYEPTRTAITMLQLYEKDQVFELIGNVRTLTAAVALPYALDRRRVHWRGLTKERSARSLCLQLSRQLR
jgi:hypothetical protein